MSWLASHVSSGLGCLGDKEGTLALWLPFPYISWRAAWEWLKLWSGCPSNTECCVDNTPSRVCNENAVFLEHFKVRKPLNHTASFFALQQLPPTPSHENLPYFIEKEPETKIKWYIWTKFIIPGKFVDLVLKSSTPFRVIFNVPTSFT